MNRYGFTSQEIARGSDGALSRCASPSRARAGNWLPTGGMDRYMLMLRLYDTPVGVATAHASATPRCPSSPRWRAAHDPLAAYHLLGGVLLGGMVHLVSVLALPRIATPRRLFAAGADHGNERGDRAAARPSRATH